MKQHEQLLRFLVKHCCINSEQVKRGKRLFNATCGACHVGGITKQSNVGWDSEALSLTPRRIV
jgi:photosystem II cytochrome c550